MLLAVGRVVTRVSINTVVIDIDGFYVRKVVRKGVIKEVRGIEKVRKTERSQA